MTDNNLLSCIVLVQNGKIIEKPERDNVQVHPCKLPGTVKHDSQAILADLKKLFPKCIFTWFATPVPKLQGEEKPQGEEPLERPETKKEEPETKKEDPGLNEVGRGARSDASERVPAEPSASAPSESASAPAPAAASQSEVTATGKPHKKGWLKS